MESEQSQPIDIDTRIREYMGDVFDIAISGDIHSAVEGVTRLLANDQARNHLANSYIDRILTSLEESLGNAALHEFESKNEELIQWRARKGMFLAGLTGEMDVHTVTFWGFLELQERIPDIKEYIEYV